MAMQSRTVLITGQVSSPFSFTLPLEIQDDNNLHSCSPGGIGYSLAREFHSRGLAPENPTFVLC
jgi:hypothetical protein